MTWPISQFSRRDLASWDLAPAPGRSARRVNPCQAVLLCYPRELFCVGRRTPLPLKLEV